MHNQIFVGAIELWKEYVIQLAFILCQTTIITPPIAIPPTFATQKKERKTKNK